MPDMLVKLYKLPETNNLYKKLEDNGVAVKKGVFGADMKIDQLSDGPVTIIYDI